jgi:hypothetical protein
MTKAPAIQFYIGDWLKDPKLSMCSPSTRGIWMDLLCAMHELDRSGLITGTTDQLARLCRCTAVEISVAVSELKETKAADVTERNGIVTVINRRMLREAKSREDNNNRVKRHRGNAPVTDLKRDSNIPSSSSSSFSTSNTSSSSSELSQSTRAREPADDDDFLANDPPGKSGNGHLSKFDEDLCKEFVVAVLIPRGGVNRPGGLGHSIWVKGNHDEEIQAWLDSGKKPEQARRKGMAVQP